MQWIKRHWKFALILPAIVFVAASCDGIATTPSEQEQVQSNQDKLTNAVPIPQLENSLERANISKRLQTFDSTDKVSYIYLVSFGKVMSFYTVKGKVTSSTKRLTSNQKQADSSNCGGQSYQCELVMESPGLDGSYGASDEYVYFWTTDNTYVQWSGDYMLSDKPLKLTTAPELVQQAK